MRLTSRIVEEQNVIDLVDGKDDLGEFSDISDIDIDKITIPTKHKKPTNYVQVREVFNLLLTNEKRFHKKLSKSTFIEKV